MALLRSNLCTFLQRMSEVHDYKYQQLHEQLGYVQGDAGLETAFYLKAIVVCLLYLVTVFPDFFVDCCGSSSVGTELVEVNVTSPQHLMYLETSILMFPHELSSFPSFQFNLRGLFLLSSLVTARARTHFPPTCKFNFESLEIDIAVQHYKL